MLTASKLDEDEGSKLLPRSLHHFSQSINGATSSPRLQAGCWEPEEEDKRSSAAVPLKTAGLGK